MAESKASKKFINNIMMVYCTFKCTKTKQLVHTSTVSTIMCDTMDDDCVEIGSTVIATVEVFVLHKDVNYQRQKVIPKNKMLK